jgi:hypothetical protein
MATLWDIPGPLVMAAASGVLAYLAWRERGLRLADACRCGYGLTGNTSGVCPECGLPADEGRAFSERARVLAAARRTVFWIFAVVLAGVLVAALTLRALGERAYTDCRAVLVPRERLYTQVELLWRVDAPGSGPARSSSVRAVLTGLDGSRITRDFGAGTETAAVEAWVVGRCPTGSDAKDEAAEVAGSVQRALAGASVLMPGGVGSAHTLLAAGAVQTVETPRWPVVGVALVAAVGGVWGGRGVRRRAMSRAG